MSTGPTRIPSVARRMTALVMAALSAVVIMTVFILAQEVLPNLVANLPLPGSVLLWMLPFYLFFGSAIAIPLCLIAGLPLWHFAIRAGRHSLRDAHRCGLIASAIIGTGIVILVLVDGYTLPKWYDALLFAGGMVLAGRCAGGVAHRIGYPSA